MQSYECVIISTMFLIYFISYGCNGGALVFLGGAEASASPFFALPMFITIKKIIILHLFLGVPAATVGGTGTPWHTRGYAPDPKYKLISQYLCYLNVCNTEIMKCGWKDRLCCLSGSAAAAWMFHIISSQWSASSMFCRRPYQWMTAFTSEVWWWPNLWFINMGSY